MNEVDELERPGAATEQTAARQEKIAVEHDGTRALEAQLRLVTEQVPAHLWTTDDQLRVTSISGSTFAQLGVDPSAYVGTPLPELIPDRPVVVAAHQAALRGESVEYEHEFRGRLFECRIRPLRDATGQVIGCLGLALDITESQQGQRRLVTQHKVSWVLAEATDLDEAAPRILGTIGDCLGWAYGGLWMVDRTEDVLRCEATWYAPGQAIPELEAINLRVAFARSVGLPGRAWATRQPVWVADATTETDFPRLAVAAMEGLRGGFGLPILIAGDVIGVIEFFDRKVREPDPELLEMAAALGGQIGQFVERTRAEATARETGARTAAILASALDAVITIDHNGCIIEFNPAAERIFGYARTEAIDREMAELIVPPSLRDQHRQGLARYLSDGNGPVLDRRVEMTAMRADGTEFPVELAVTCVPTNGPPLFTGYVRDITDRKRAEGALRAHARQQAAVAGLGQRALAMPDVVAVMDEAVAVVARTLEVEYCKVLELLPDGEVLLLRAGVGWREGLVGRTTVGSGTNSQAGYTLCSDAPVIVTDLRTETRFSGPPLLLEHNVVSGMSVVIPGPNGPFGVLGTHTTEQRVFTSDDAHFLQTVATVLATALRRKDFEERLAREHAEAERLEALERTREEFLAAISHDLKTPLTAAHAGLGMLEMSANNRLGPEERDLLGNSRRSVQRLGFLIDDLLAYNQLTSGTLDLDVEPVDLREVIVNALPSVHPLIQHKEQTLVIDLPKPVTVAGDAQRLEQVVVNLLANANRHTPPGTRITVMSHLVDGDVRLTVTDDGPGIPSEELDVIFQRFYRPNSSHNPGSGLGLAIAKEIVELHGGRIWAESEAGEGTVVHVALPRREEASSHAP